MKAFTEIATLTEKQSLDAFSIDTSNWFSISTVRTEIAQCIRHGGKFSVFILPSHYATVCIVKFFIAFIGHIPDTNMQV